MVEIEYGEQDLKEILKEILKDEYIKYINERGEENE